MKINLSAKYKYNTIFVRFFLSLLGTSAVAVIILSIVMYYWFAGKSVVEISKASTMALSNIDTVVSNYFDSSKRIAMELYQTPDIKSLILTNGEEWNDNMATASSRILSTMSVNTYITSIYVFSGSHIILKPTSIVIPTEYENTFFDMVRNNKTARPLPWVLERKNGSKTYMATIFFKEGSADDLSGAVMLNINMRFLHDKIFANLQNKDQEIYVIDKNGKILLDNEMNMYGKDVSSQKYFTELINAGKDQGSLKLEMSGREYYLSFVTAANKEYYTISLMDYSLGLKELTGTRDIVIMVSLLLLFCIIIASIAISYKVYKPIGNILTNIRSMFGNTSQNQVNMNEIQLAYQSVAQIIDRMNSYEKESQKNVIRKLLLSTGNMTVEELEKDLKYLGLSRQNTQNYCIIVLRVCNYKSFIKNTGQAVSLQLNSIGSIASEFFTGKVKCDYCDVSDDHVVLIIAEETGKVPLGDIDAGQLMGGAQDIINRMLGLEITIGISGICYDIGSITDKYHQAYDLTNNRLIYGKLSIFDTAMVNENCPQDDLNYHTKMVLESVRKHSREAFENTIDEFINKCRQKKLHYKAVIKVFSMLAASIEKIPEETGIAKKNENTSLIDTYMQVESMEDCLELKNWLIAIYLDTTDKLSAVNNKGVHDIVGKAVEYIDKNYSNPDITANSIAEQLSISLSYFSRIFKEYTGTNFQEYIINIRLENSKEILLQDDSETVIKSVCYKVGYSNTSYFTAAFKKKFGVTPSKYRQHCLNKGEISNN